MNNLLTMNDEWLTTGDSARILKRSPEAVRGYVRMGKLPAQKTQSGQRLFKASDVDQLAKQLAKSGRKKRCGW